MTAPLGGVVLAGGAGERLGQPKATVDFHGEPLAARAVRLLRAAGCGPLVVSARAGRPLPSLDVPVVWDPPEADGVLEGLATALASVEADDVLVVACDLPLAGPLLARLAAAPPGEAVVAVDASGEMQPLCARYPRRLALEAAAAALAADRRVQRWADTLSPTFVSATGNELLNCNTPEDLATALAAAEP